MFANYTERVLVDSETAPYGIQIVRFNISEPFKGKNVSMAYEQPYKMFEADCYNCNEGGQIMDFLTIDGLTMDEY